ncbi:enoyl-CoA hydratase/isomerase family protein [Rhizobium sp. RM]|uniref:enoyl-CoA hydratase/isomerase family protein n=1 Tax=Rhizobium sp. RM TaxID=2748079 RepID=UPI00110F120E|nr:enoyl-CoA hydratase/isomerase family protein [Rhizobium sp. RM]NWJ25336.1 enoyl-CoA hydratase/isomerase family protein [Rhizobium sp. RM]TMV17577.1 enoyl-CoA hydratase/isomerase family protein [Rhizobium sp. Td3]
MAIDYLRDGAIATIRLNRPEKLNALTLAMYDDLGRAFAEAGRDDAVNVVVLTGAGDRAFCVGADLTESIPALAEGRFDISKWDPAHLKVEGFFKPVVGAVNGLCIGGGFEIMLATDIRVASSTALFQLPEPQHGFVPAGGTLVRLVRQIGYAHAMEIMLTGERFSAADMLTRGVVNRVVETVEVEPVVYELANRIASLSPGAVQTIKEAALTLQHLPLKDAFTREANLGQRTFESEDARRGLAAFANRNKRN